LHIGEGTTNQNVSGSIILNVLWIRSYKFSKMQSVGYFKNHVGDAKMHLMHTWRNAIGEKVQTTKKVLKIVYF